MPVAKRENSDFKMENKIQRKFSRAARQKYSAKFRMSTFETKTA